MVPIPALSTIANISEDFKTIEVLTDGKEIKFLKQLKQTQN